MATADLRKSSSDAVISTLKWVRKQGFKPVALHKQSKASIDDKFIDPAYKPPSDDLWLGRDLGIGVVVGPKQGGPVDIDLDCQEAIFFAARFLPQTAAIFGRKSKLKSHYLYRIDAETFVKRAFNDPLIKPGAGGTTIIEMRGDGGHQTVFPGSIHELSGEEVVWHDALFPEVPRVDPEILEKAVKKIAIATLIVRHMWVEGQRNEVLKHLAGMFYYLEWSDEETKDLIRAIMEYTGDEDKTRLRTVTATYKKGESGGKITGSNTLRDFIGDAKLVDRILEWAGSEQAGLLQAYNERFACVTVEGKFRIAETTPLNKGEPPTLYAINDFLNVMATDTMVVDGEKGPKKLGKADLWLANPRRRSYRSLDFLPGQEDTGQVLNLWTGWATDAKKGGSCKAWLDLLYYTICGQHDDTYSWMLHWFANIVREPMNKSLTAPVVIGMQGAGKSLLFGYFGEILGPAYTVITNEEHIYGRFNQHLGTTLLLHSEEALYGGERKHKGILKSLITDNYRMFEPKGINAKQIKNHLRLVLTSNDIHAAPAETGDRRYTILDLEGRKAPITTVNAVLKELKETGPAALFDYLLTMPYDPQLARVNIKNDSLAAMKQINLDPAAAWWYDCLKNGQLLPDYLVWACRPEKAEWPMSVSSAALFVSMKIKSRERNIRYTPEPTGFALQLNKMLGVKLNRQQKYYTNPMSDMAPQEVKLLSSKQSTIVNMPNLLECRKSFEDYIGQDITWPRDADKDDTPAYAQF